MNRILFDVPKWHVLQHRDARNLELPTGNDSPRRMFEDELFDKLYSGACDPLPAADRNATLALWAEQVHAACEQLPSFARLAAECRGVPFAAAAAVESLLGELAELPPLNDKNPAAAKALRRAINAGCAKASDAIDELREAVEGLGGVAFGPAAGTSTEQAHAVDSDAVRSLASRLKDDWRLRRIALLAGRFRRIAASKRRQRVNHGADEITDITQGADLARALPAELTRLTRPRLRLHFFRSLLERQIVQYHLTGSDTLGRGPIILLLDKSTSMDKDNRDIWAAAVALALMQHAHQEKRPFALVAFTGRIVGHAYAPPGQPIPWELLNAPAESSTDIAGAVQFGLDLIPNGGAHRKSDLVLITDGQSETDEAAQLRARALELKTSILGLAIGFPAENLAPWCDEAHAVTDLSTLPGDSATALFGS